MTPHHHIHMGPALRAALVGSALLLAAASAGLAEGGGAVDPDQAIVFDGSTAANDIFTLAFKNDGYVVELSQIAFVCPDADHVSTGGLFALVEDAGVFRLELEIGETLLIPVPSPAGEAPDPLAEAETDCDLLEELPALGAYLGSVDVQAQTRLLETEACRNRVRALYCQLVDTVEEAETVLDIDEEAAFQEANGGYYGNVQSGPQEPCPGLTALTEIPVLLDHLVTLRGTCEARETSLAVLLARVVDTIQGVGGLTAEEKEKALASADEALGRAEQTLLEAAETAVELDALKTPLTEESLEASCEACDDPGLVTGIPFSGFVQLAARRQVLGRFVGAFHSAANQTDDPELAARLADLAERLAEVPNDRVLQVLFPAGSAVGQHMLAIRSPELSDDGESPLVVVLTAVEPAEGTPPLNAADIQLLFEQIRLFEATLAREPDRDETHD